MQGYKKNVGLSIKNYKLQILLVVKKSLQVCL